MTKQLTPRMIELINESFAQVGNFVIVKMDKTGIYRVESVEKIAITIDKNGLTTDLLTLNNFVFRFTVYSKSYESRKEAEEVCMSLNNKREQL